MTESYETYKSVANKKIPIQIFWGEFDEVLAQPSKDLLDEISPEIDFHIIKGAGHSSNYEKPDLLNPLLLNFLKK